MEDELFEDLAQANGDVLVMRHLSYDPIDANATRITGVHTNQFANFRIEARAKPKAKGRAKRQPVNWAGLIGGEETLGAGEDDDHAGPAALEPEYPELAEDLCLNDVALSWGPLAVRVHESLQHNFDASNIIVREQAATEDTQVVADKAFLEQVAKTPITHVIGACIIHASLG